MCSGKKPERKRSKRPVREQALQKQNKNKQRCALFNLPVWEQGLKQKQIKTQRNRCNFTVLVHLYALVIHKMPVEMSIIWLTDRDNIRRNNVIEVFIMICWQEDQPSIILHYDTLHRLFLYTVWVRVMIFNATFNNISIISWQSDLLVEETGD